MRVAYLVPRCLPEYSHGRYVIELARRLANRVSVDIYSSAFSNGLRPTVRCHFLPVLNRPAVARLALLWAGAAVTSAATRFDIVHTQGADAPTGNVVTASYCNAAEAERLRLQPGDQSSGYTRRRVMNAVGAVAERYCMAKSTTRRVIAVSHGVKGEVTRLYGVGPNRISVIHYGVDLEQFHPAHQTRWRDEIRRQYLLSPKSFVVLFVGGDYRRKGLLPLMQAIQATGRSDIELLVVGAEPGSDVAKCAAQLHLDGRLRFAKSTSEISRFYAAADAFALPTRYDTFSLATLEAMASGLPVVVSRNAGVAEIMTDGVDGMVLPVGWDIQNLGERLARLATDRDECGRLGEQARQTAEQHSWDLMARRTFDVYEQVAQTRDGSRQDV